MYPLAVLLSASPPSSLPDDPAHTSPHWQFRSGGKGDGFIYLMVLSLNPNKSVPLVEKCNKEWASLPGSPYGQPTVKLEDVVAEYNNMVSQELAGESDLPMKVGFIADLME